MGPWTYTQYLGTMHEGLRYRFSSRQVVILLFDDHGALIMTPISSDHTAICTWSLFVFVTSLGPKPWQWNEACAYQSIFSTLSTGHYHITFSVSPTQGVSSKKLEHHSEVCRRWHTILTALRIFKRAALCYALPVVWRRASGKMPERRPDQPTQLVLPAVCSVWK